jgi:hypothetical protein
VYAVALAALRSIVPVFTTVSNFVKIQKLIVWRIGNLGDNSASQ